MRPEPFQIRVPGEVIQDLRTRLIRTRWPDEVPGAGWEYGTNLTFMRQLTDYWVEEFDWRTQEHRLNQLLQYRVDLNGTLLHFIHVPGIGPDPTPLLLVHGWPGSICEFRDLIPRLTDPASFGGNPEDAFTIVAPSLPGYTLSYRRGQDRVGITQTTDLLARLMTDVLGYKQFGAQGGDWGGYIVGRLAHTHSEEVIGAHLNFLPLPPDLHVAEPNSDEQRTYERELDSWRKEESGYGNIQGTRPQTLAYGLTDSPVGLAAWITEKFHSWTDHSGDLRTAIDLDLLLTNITLYWVTGAINSSFWFYYDFDHGPFPIPRALSQTPVAYASFPAEIRHPPRPLAAQVFNITSWTEMPRGGHFAAVEAPDLLAADIADFFRSIRQKGVGS